MSLSVGTCPRCPKQVRPFIMPSLEEPLAQFEPEARKLDLQGKESAEILAYHHQYAATGWKIRSFLNLRVSTLSASLNSISKPFISTTYATLLRLYDIIRTVSLPLFFVSQSTLDFIRVISTAVDIIRHDSSTSLGRCSAASPTSSTTKESLWTPTSVLQRSFVSDIVDWFDIVHTTRNMVCVEHHGRCVLFSPVAVILNQETNDWNSWRSGWAIPS